MELDVGAAASHVSSHRDSPWLPRVGDDFRLLSVLARIEDDGLQARLDEQLLDLLRSADRACPDQYRSILSRRFLHRFNCGMPLQLSRWQDASTEICPAQWSVGRDAH